MSFGYTVSSEEHLPRDLVRNARRAEEAGFDFVSISDHFHPWVSAQGHSPFVWSALGAIAASTERLRVGVGVTCPIVRVHPAVLAQATATTSLLFEGQLWTGETIDHRGDFYEVDNARIFDPPAEAPPVIVSAFGPKAIDLAARIGDGYWGTSPQGELVDRYRETGGSGPRYTQLDFCWATDAAAAAKPTTSTSTRSAPDQEGFLRFWADELAPALN